MIYKWIFVFLKGLQEMAHHTCSQSGPSIVRNSSTLTLPPSYDLLMGATGGLGGPSEAPPPSYEEAMFLIDEKLKTVLDCNASHSLSKYVCFFLIHFFLVIYSV